MKRVRLPRKAADVMDSGAAAWLYKYARKNYWRVAPWMEFEDLIQDGAMLWVSTRRRYTSAIFIPHVMRLFQVTYINHIHDLARAHSLQHETPISQFDEDSALRIVNLQADEFDDLLKLMAEAPGHLRELIAAMHSNPQIMRSKTRRRLDGTRTTLNDRMKRAVGASPKRYRNYAGNLRRFLEEQYV